MSSALYDYAIVGTGAAGLQLALAMLDAPFFKDKRVILFDKDAKTENDRTWCYWEKGKGAYDHLLYKSWTSGYFFSSKESIALVLHPYTYKMLRSAAFYDYAKQRISESAVFTRVQQEVLRLNENAEEVSVITKEATFRAKHVFDSRIDPAYYSDMRATKILQHFKGWIIESEEAVFDPEKFVMMDYRFRVKDTTSFIYVLPFSKHAALVEFTFFTPALVADEVYDAPLIKYIKEIPGMKKYTISETERGLIPMSDYNFHQHHTHRITKIGTAGAWVKASSGYSFRKGTLLSKRIVEAIQQKQSLSSVRSKPRFRFYDKIFLEVLNHQNEIGEDVFAAMYAKNHVTQIFRFLDEETTLTEELKIINSFPHRPFLKALYRHFIKKN